MMRTHPNQPTLNRFYIATAVVVVFWQIRVFWLLPNFDLHIASQLRIPISSCVNACFLILPYALFCPSVVYDAFKNVVRCPAIPAAVPVVFGIYVLAIVCLSFWLTKSAFTFELARHLTLHLLALSVIAVFVEEFFARGILLEQLRTRFSGVGANLLATAVFVSLHYSSWLFAHYGKKAMVTESLIVAGLSLTAGYLFLRTKSIWPGFVLHLIHNLMLASTYAA